MHQYILRRLFMTGPTLLGVSLIIFAIMRLLPGDVALVIATRGGEGTTTEQEVAALREQLGLTDPLPLQYLKFIGGLMRLDAGNSLWSGRPVMQELLSRLPLTLELAALAVAFSLVIAIPLGILSAVRQDTWADYLFRFVSIAGLALPNFWIGVLIILFLSLSFHWLPPLGYTDLFTDPAKNLQQLVWPALALGYRQAAVVSRMTRSAMLEVLREDYIRTAWAKGLEERAVLFRHALKNALLPVITLSSVQLGGLLGGAVIMETIFTLPGIGRLLIDSLAHRDYPMVQSIVVLLAFMVTFVNLVVDLLYAWLNPRIRYA